MYDCIDFKVHNKYQNTIHRSLCHGVEYYVLWTYRQRSCCCACRCVACIMRRQISPVLVSQTFSFCSSVGQFCGINAPSHNFVYQWLLCNSSHTSTVICVYLCTADTYPTLDEQICTHSCLETRVLHYRCSMYCVEKKKTSVLKCKSM